MLLFFLLQAILLLSIHASKPPAIRALDSRKVLGPFTVNSTGEVQGRLGIEHYGFGFVLCAAPNRPVDRFFLNGNILIAEDRNGSCYVNPDTFHLHCEDVPEGVPHSATKFGVANNGTIVFKGSANWFLCPSQIPNTYDVYYNNARMRKPSPYCKDAQLKINIDNKKKRSTNDDIGLLNALRHCPFVLSTVASDSDDKSLKSSPFGPFIVSGRSLMTSKDYRDYCFVDSISRQLLCRDKSDPAVIADWQTINFSLSDNKNLKHGNSDQWYICQNTKGNTIGPFDAEKRETDPACATKLLSIHLKAQHPAKIEQCRDAKWSPQGAKHIAEAFIIDGAKDINKEKATKLKPRAPRCPKTLVDTPFKSPSLVVPIVQKNATKLSGNEEQIVLLPLQSAAVNFYIPFTKPYFGKTCSMIFLIPHINTLKVEPQAAPPAIEISILDQPVDELTTWKTLSARQLLGSKQISKDNKFAEDSKETSLASFPCQVGTTMSFLIASKGGLSLVVRQGGVPNESGLHIVPCTD